MEITRPPRIRRDVWTPFDGRFAEKLPADHTEFDKVARLTIAEKTQLIIDDVKFKATLAVMLTPHVFTIIRGRIVKNWKTTVTGIVGAIAVLAQSIFGIIIPQEAVIAVTLFVLSLFASDSK